MTLSAFAELLRHYSNPFASTRLRHSGTARTTIPIMFPWSAGVPWITTRVSSHRDGNNKPQRG